MALALDAARARLQLTREQAEEFCVSVMDMGGEGSKEEEEQQRAHEERKAEEDAPAAVAASAAADGSVPSASPPLPICVPRSCCDGSCLVLRLWHMDVFVGARESARGDPGAYCRDLHFAPRLSGEGSEAKVMFRHQLSLADTDAIMEEDEADLHVE